MDSKENFFCYSFGYGRYGQLGFNSDKSSNIPKPISMPESIFSISAGDGHSILLTDSLKLFSFGKNSFGQLGLGHTSAVSTPTQIFSLNSKKIEEVVCGSEHTLALSSDGEVFAWGLNLKGQLGLGDSSNRLSPTLCESVSAKTNQFQGSSLEPGEKVVSLSCGGLHSLLLTNKNKAMSCGHGKHYATAFHEDSFKFQKIPALEGLGKVEKIQAGLMFSAGIIQGNLIVWGKIASVFVTPTQLVLDRKKSPSSGNPCNSLAEGRGNRASSPRTGNFEGLACGESFLAAVAKGKLWIFGTVSGRVFEELTLLETPSKVKNVSCGTSHAACITDENFVFFWGSNEFGQCADVSACASPVQSRLLACVLKVSCGSNHTLLLSSHQLSPAEVEISDSSVQSSSICSPCPHSSELRIIQQEFKSLSEKYSALVLKMKTLSSIKTEPCENSKYLSPYFEISFSELQIDPEPIGRGGYGTVFKGNFRGTVVAVKKMKIEEPLGRSNRADRAERLERPDKSGKISKVEEFLQECQTMMSVRHPNIVLFIGACTVQPELALILEYCGNGSLWDVLRNHNTPLPWYLRCKIALDIARGVNYLHNFPRPVLHRDLKSLNILLDDAMNAKLADFGWTRFKAETMTNKIGTYQWMAPEVIQGQQYSEKADVYSFGIILWEIATRKPPFKDLNGVQVSQEVVKNHLRPTITKRCPEPFSKLMQRCWDREPANRPNFNEIILELEGFLKFIEKTAVN